MKSFGKNFSFSSKLPPPAAKFYLPKAGVDLGFRLAELHCASLLHYGSDNNCANVWYITIDNISTTESTSADSVRAPTGWLILLALVLTVMVSDPDYTGTMSTDKEAEMTSPSYNNRSGLHSFFSKVSSTVSSFLGLQIPTSEPPQCNTQCSPDLFKPSQAVTSLESYTCPSTIPLPPETDDDEEIEIRFPNNDGPVSAIVNSTPLSSKLQPAPNKQPTNLKLQPFHLPDLCKDMMHEISEHITPTPDDIEKPFIPAPPPPPLIESVEYSTSAWSESEEDEKISKACSKSKTRLTQFMKNSAGPLPKIISESGRYTIPVSRGVTRELLYVKDFMPPAEATKLYKLIDKTVALKAEDILVKGKKNKTPRVMAWHGPCEYTFSKCTLKPTKDPESLQLMEDILHLYNEYGIANNIIDKDRPLNSLLLNKYRDGDDSVGWHPDLESIFEEGYPILGGNLGVDRYLDVARAGLKTKKTLTSVLCTNGSMYGMLNDFQSVLMHRVPKSNTTLPRINATARRVNDEAVAAYAARMNTSKTSRSKPEDQAEVEEPEPVKQPAESQGLKRKQGPSSPVIQSTEVTSVALETLQDTIVELTNRVTYQTSVIESTTSQDSSVKNQFLQINKQIADLARAMNDGFLKTHDLLETLTQSIELEKQVAPQLFTAQPVNTPAVPAPINPRLFQRPAFPIFTLPLPPLPQQPQTNPFTSAPSPEQCKAATEPSPNIFKKPVTPAPLRIPVQVQVHRERPNRFSALASPDIQSEDKISQPVMKKSAFSDHRSYRDVAEKASTDSPAPRRPRSNSRARNNPSRSNSRQQQSNNEGKNIVLLCDSLFQYFEQDKFGESFKVNKQIVGSYKNLAKQENLREMVRIPGVDAYVIALGTNDVRDVYNKSNQGHVADVIDHLQKRTNSKILIHVPPPRLHDGPKNKRLDDFAYDIKKYVTSLGDSRISFIENARLRDGRFDDTTYKDDVHISEEGSAILNAGVKSCLRRVFGMSISNSRSRANRR